MPDHLSTQQVAWILDRSPGTVRDLIKDGQIEAIRIVGGFRIPKAEAIRLARERVRAEDGRKLSDTELERLIDDLIATNEAELFAVATEAFFERPVELSRKHPALYAMLREAYGQDPARREAQEERDR